MDEEKLKEAGIWLDRKEVLISLVDFCEATIDEVDMVFRKKQHLLNRLELLKQFAQIQLGEDI